MIFTPFRVIFFLSYFVVSDDDEPQQFETVNRHQSSETASTCSANASSCCSKAKSISQANKTTISKNYKQDSVIPIRTSKEQKDALDLLCTKIFIACNVSFVSVEQPAFLNFVKKFTAWLYST